MSLPTLPLPYAWLIDQAPDRDHVIYIFIKDTSANMILASESVDVEQIYVERAFVELIEHRAMSLFVRCFRDMRIPEWIQKNWGT